MNFEQIPYQVLFDSQGRAFGVFLGCIIGMCPLLFLDTKVDKDDKDDETDAKKSTVSKS